MTVEERIVWLEGRLAYYREKAATFDERDDTRRRAMWSNPWVGLARGTERTLKRLYGELGGGAKPCEGLEVVGDQC